MEREKNLTVHYTGIQVGYWAAMAVFNSLYVPILRERGFSGNEISILLALRYGVVVAVQPVLAAFADRHADRIPLKYIVAVINGVGFVASLLFALCRPGMLGTGLLIAVNGCAMGLLVSFNDSLAMRYVNQGRALNYSFARAFGSVAFAVSSLILGYLTAAYGIDCAPFAQAVILGVKFLVVITFADSGRQQVKEKQKSVHSAWYLLTKYPQFSVFLMAVFLLYIGNVMYLNFVIDLVEKLGGNSQSLGIIHFIMSASELPLAFTMARIRQKVPNRILLVVSAIFILLRMVLVANASGLGKLMAVQVLNMLGFGVYFSSSVLFVNEVIPKEDQVKGQALMGVASSAGLAGMAGSFISGALSDASGVELVMHAVAGCMFAGLLAMAAAVWMSYRRDKKVDQKNR